VKPNPAPFFGKTNVTLIRDPKTLNRDPETSNRDPNTLKLGVQKSLTLFDQSITHIDAGTSSGASQVALDVGPVILPQICW